MAAGNNGDGRCELTESDLIWNRACSGGGLSPMPGDRALASLLKVHGLAMNGGVLHAVECLKPSEISDAKSGYSFFGLDSIADLLSRARRILEASDDLEYHESRLDKQYAILIPDNSSLGERFIEHLKLHPSDFAPL